LILQLPKVASVFSSMHRSAGIVASVGLHIGISHIDSIYDIHAESQYRGAKWVFSASSHEFYLAAVACIVTRMNRAKNGYALDSGLGPALFLAS
jgi:hypothetical protein